MTLERDIERLSRDYSVYEDSVTYTLYCIECDKPYVLNKYGKNTTRISALSKHAERHKQEWAGKPKEQA